jgi:carbonic anhydrase
VSDAQALSRLVGGLILGLLLSFQPGPVTAAADPDDPMPEGTRPSRPDHQPQNWAYEGVEGPDHWAMLSPAYRTCEKGSHQSPINIQAAHSASGPGTLALAYRPARVRLMHTGHTVQATYQAGSVLAVDGTNYLLRQFHFHSPSEHHIEGQSFDMEIHLVHQSEEGRIAIVAVLLEVGLENHTLERLWADLPEQVGRVSKEVELNAIELLPTQTHYYLYEGSLTVPPCTEGVRWIVLKEPQSVSLAQLTRFRTFLGEDARPVQALNHREVRAY